MRLVAASALASFALLMPFKLHALEIAPEARHRLHQILLVVAEPSVPAATAEAAGADDDDASRDKREERAVSIEEICSTVASAAKAHDLPVLFFLRLIWQESRFDPRAISHAGAQGIAQFMPRVARAMGLDDPFDPIEALPISARFLRDLHEQFGNIGLAAAAYNAGARRIKEWLANRGKLPRETRNYVEKITGVAAEQWAKSAPEELELKKPPAPCNVPDSVVVRSSIIPLPVSRPGTIQVASADMKNSEVSAAAKAHKHEPKEKSAAPPSVKTLDRGWSVHVTTRWTEADSMRTFQRLRREFPALASAPKLVVERSKSRKGAQKTSVKLAAPTRSAANDLCAKFKKSGGSCTVVRNN